MRFIQWTISISESKYFINIYKYIDVFFFIYCVAVSMMYTPHIPVTYFQKYKKDTTKKHAKF